MQYELKKQRKTNGFSTCSATYCKKHRFCFGFCNLSAKNQGKLMVFQYVQQNIAKPQVLYCFLQSECNKPRKTNGFSIFSATYCKNHKFCNVFCNLSAKNQGKPMVFQFVQQHIANKHRFCNVFCNLIAKNQGKLLVLQYVQQNIANSTGSVMFLAIWVQKTTENQWFFICSAKYCKKHRFYIRFSNTLDAQTKENQWFFSMFSKI